MKKIKQPIDVTLRIKEILSSDLEYVIDSDTGEFSYTFRGGKEFLSIRKNSQRGEFRYSGVFHPNGKCEGDGLCIYCGVTLF